MPNTLTFTQAGGALAQNSLTALEDNDDTWWSKIQVHGSDLETIRQESSAFHSHLLWEIYDGTNLQLGNMILQDKGTAGRIDIKYTDKATNGVTVTVTTAFDTAAWYTIFVSSPSGANHRVSIHKADGTLVGDDTLGFGSSTNPDNTAGSRVIAVAQQASGENSSAGFPGEIGGFAFYDGTPPSRTSTSAYDAPATDDANIVAYAPFSEGSGSTTDDQVATSFTYDLTGQTWGTDAGAWGDGGGGGTGFVNRKIVATIG